MNFLDFHYFLTAVEEMNFTRAAERLFITQQSLSGRIAKLESHFGVELFDRTPPLSLTEAGACLAKNARVLLLQKDQMEVEIESIKGFQNSTLSVGVLHDRGAVSLPAILTRFREEFPDIVLRVFESTPDKIAEALNSGAADLTIGFPIEEEGIQSVNIYRETFVAVVPLQIFRTYFTAREQEQMLRADALPVETFLHCPFITYNRMTWVKQIFEDCCRQAGVEPNIVLETSNMMTRSAMCFSGFGIMFAAQSFFLRNTHLLDPTQLKKVKIFKIDCLDFYKDVSINFLKKKYRSKASLEFIRVAKQALSDLEAVP